jgi:hypothetical protein
MVITLSHYARKYLHKIFRTMHRNIYIYIYIYIYIPYAMNHVRQSFCKLCVQLLLIVIIFLPVCLDSCHTSPNFSTNLPQTKLILCINSGYSPAQHIKLSQ